MADRVKEIVEGNKRLKEEMSQKVDVSIELKEEDLVSLLLKSVKVSLNKGGKRYFKAERMSEVKTTDERELLVKLEQARAEKEELKKVSEE